MKHVKIDYQDQRILYTALLNYADTAKKFFSPSDWKRVEKLLEELRPTRESIPFKALK
jgi:hypothetical protein